jgi:hypothetical protein
MNRATFSIPNYDIEFGNATVAKVVFIGRPAFLSLGLPSHANMRSERLLNYSNSLQVEKTARDRNCTVGPVRV